MKEYTLQHFGTLSTKNLEEYYVVNIEFEGDEIEIDLNFEKKTIKNEDFRLWCEVKTKLWKMSIIKGISNIF